MEGLDDLRERMAWFRTAGDREGFHESDAVRLRALLTDLRRFCFDYPDESEVRPLLAEALVVAHGNAGEILDDDLAQNLLDELRVLSKQHPDDREVRAFLALGLGRVFRYACVYDADLAQALREEFRSLFSAYPDEPFIKGIYAQAFWLVLSLTGFREHTFDSALLGELRALAFTYPEEKSLTRTYVQTLNTLVPAVRERAKALELYKLFLEVEDLTENYATSLAWLQWWWSTTDAKLE